jgi:hypothetical protein
VAEEDNTSQQSALQSDLQDCFDNIQEIAIKMYRKKDIKVQTLLRLKKVHRNSIPRNEVLLEILWQHCSGRSVIVRYNVATESPIESPNEFVGCGTSSVAQGSSKYCTVIWIISRQKLPLYPAIDGCFLDNRSKICLWSCVQMEHLKIVFEKKANSLCR